MRARTPQQWDATQYHIHNWSYFVHKERDEATIRIGQNLLPDPDSITDLSAGGGRIAPEIARYFGVEPFLSDLSQQYGYPVHGPMEEILPNIQDTDLFIFTETVEHLEEPFDVLRGIRAKAKRLLMSTPTMEEVHIQAHGHLWVWDREGVEEMLHETGWTPVTFEQVSIFGIWVCE